MQTPQSAQTETSEKCSIVEILQYTCELGATHEGKPEVRCIPVPRLFRICPGSPAVEITTSVKIDSTTGEVELPKQINIKGKPWTSITRYEDQDNLE